MRSAVSFSRALFGTCSGLEVFWVLRNQSWGRIIWHMCLMGVFCSLLITWGENSRVRPAISAGVRIFKSVFGEKVSCDKNGFLPEKNPGVSRSVALPNDGRLWYLAQGKIQSSVTEIEKNSYVIFWAPKGFATCVQNVPGQWQISVIQPEKERMMLSGKKNLSSSQLLEMSFTSPWDWQLGENTSFTAEEIGKFFSGMTGMTYFVQNLLLTLLLPLIYTAVFVGMFRLTSGGRYPLCLSYREFWKMGIYAGFPALLVASAFPALNLPFLTFSTVYMVGLLIYWLYAVSKIDRMLFENSPEENADEQ